jgi:hypothetical protein
MRQVVLAVRASRIGAWHEEERRRAVDDNAPVVFGPRHTRAVFDLEPQAHEIRHLIVEARRIVLTSATLGKTLRCGAVASLIHHHVM